MYWMGATGSLAVVLSGGGFRGGSYRELSAGAILHLLRGRGEVQPRCLYVMAGLVPAIHVFARCTENVGARAFASPKRLRPRRRDKPGHDDRPKPSDLRYRSSRSANVPG